VTLAPGILEPDVVVGRWESRLPESQFKGRMGLRFSLEVAIVTVENLGRSSTTVSAPHLRFRHPLLRPPYQKTRRTIQWSCLPFDGYCTDSRVRLEPGDRLHFLVNATPALSVAVQDYPRGANIRASVEAGGRKPRLSSWRSRWRVRPGDRPWLFSTDTFDLTRQIFRALAQRVPSESISFVVSEMLSFEVAERLEAGQDVSREWMVELLDSWDSESRDLFPLRRATFDLYDLIQRPRGTVVDASGVPRWLTSRPPRTYNHSEQRSLWRTRCEQQESVGSSS